MQKKQVLVSFVFLIIFSLQSFAQEAKKDTSYWHKKSELGLTFNQAAFSGNWQGGGVSNIALGTFINAKGEYAKHLDGWTNDFQFQFGFQKVQKQEFRKSVDRLFFDSKYTRRLKEESKWYFFGDFNVLSQIANGFDFNETNAPRISAFFTPLYLTEAIGIEYKPSKFFNLMFAPGAVRHTILASKTLYADIKANNPEYYNAGKFKNYGVKEGNAVRTEVAVMQLVANFDKDIMKNVNLKWRYQAYASFADLAAIDNRLDANLIAQVNKYIGLNLGLILIYDQDQSFQIQAAQSMGIRFQYQF